MQTLQTLQLRKNIFKNILENLELLELLKNLEPLENLKKIIHTHSVYSSPKFHPTLKQGASNLQARKQTHTHSVYFFVKITRVVNKKSVLSVG